MNEDALSALPIVPPITVAKYYLTVAWQGLFKDKLTDDIRAAIRAIITEQDEERMWRLVESFSYTQGLNDVMRFITNASYVWTKETLPIEEVRLTGMNPAVDKIMNLESIQRHPVAFGAYLKKYFDEHPDDDPEGLGELRPSNRQIEFETIMLRQSGDDLGLLDGSHRLVEMLIQGRTTVEAYVGRGDNKAPTRIGPSIIRNLYVLYVQTKNPAIVETVKALVGQSTDGRHWVQTYWIDHITDDEIKQIGKEILG